MPEPGFAVGTRELLGTLFFLQTWLSVERVAAFGSFVSHWSSEPLSCVCFGSARRLPEGLETALAEAVSSQKPPTTLTLLLLRFCHDRRLNQEKAKLTSWQFGRERVSDRCRCAGLSLGTRVNGGLREPRPPREPLPDPPPAPANSSDAPGSHWPLWGAPSPKTQLPLKRRSSSSSRRCRAARGRGGLGQRPVAAGMGMGIGPA